eukprot:5379505-Pleurochrysis_carterae.AAC.1
MHSISCRSTNEINSGYTINRTSAFIGSQRTGWPIRITCRSRRWCGRGCAGACASGGAGAAA